MDTGDDRSTLSPSTEGPSALPGSSTPPNTGSRQARLALFDLDHTLIPFDSGLAWLRFLVGRGDLPQAAESDYLACCMDYMAGQADVRDVHRRLVQPLRESTRMGFDAWLDAFEADLGSTVSVAARRLVSQHRDAGDRCCLVTATTRFVAERYARVLGIDDVIATEAARDSFGRLTGEIVGLPCVREHKLSKLQGWLALEGQTLAHFEASWFYSDSSSDLPLLRAVTHPVTVRPDARLRAVAVQEGWPVIETLTDPAPTHPAPSP